MTTLQTIRREDAALRKWVPAVNEAAVMFERRWTLMALKRVDPDIHRRLLDQRALFDKAVVTGMARLGKGKYVNSAAHMGTSVPKES